MSPNGIRFLHQIQASNVMLFYCCRSSRAGLPTFIFYPFYFFPTLYKEIFFKHIPDHLRILLNQHSLTLAGVGEGAPSLSCTQESQPGPRLAIHASCNGAWCLACSLLERTFLPLSHGTIPTPGY